MLSLGIDLGGSGFRMGVFDLQTGELVGELHTVQFTQSPHPSTVLPQICERLDDLGWKGPVGIGFPGAVVNNIAQTAPNIGEAWKEVNMAAALQPFHDGRFHMLNDADAVAVGEQRFGYGHEDHACVLTLTIGTGLGTTVHRHGTLVPNLEYGRDPHPNREGVLEDHLSGRARRVGNWSIEAWCERFQEGLHHLEQRLQPTLILLYGGIVEHWSVIEPLLTTQATLAPAVLQSTAGPLGAAWSAVHHSQG